ncbi:polysaccharide pyruvyl transferase family protein [Georgenia alba]|uniref:Polysaccharide pyruvyl transferase family protein n=1 Tax=Georgenia alba TaxID=2233858 RepID=A0ABW2QAS4_9MICO
MSETGRPRVLLVGAYERDNFGDLLFLLQTEQYLDGAEVTAAAPFAADMRTLLDRTIPAFGPLLEGQEYDVVWTVGGEVGATSLHGAYRMSTPPGVYRAYEAASPEVRRQMLHRACGATPIDAPYMPRPTAYPGNATAASVLHSIGVAGISGMPEHGQAARLEILREADRVSVRDQLSADLLTAHAVPHRLGPDLVHTVALTRPRERPAEPGPVLVQVSEAHLRLTGLTTFAEALARSRHLAPFPIRLFLAGTARGHDSPEAYRQIVTHVRRLCPDRDIDVLPARRPLDLVDAIASARLWVGLSLHGRIVASAYGVPRLSLVKRKLDAYARTWDPDMPYGVTAETLDDAVAQALSPAVAARAGTVGEDLARTADADVRAAVDAVLGEDATSPAVLRARSARRFAALEDWRTGQVARLAVRLDERDRTIKELRGRVGAAESRAAARPADAPVIGRTLRRARALRRSVLAR